jgi:ABC-type transport system substrate-binding protein
MFSINMEIVLRGAMENPKVREALNLAVDRKGMVEGILGGLGTPSVTMPGPGTQNELRVTFDPIPYDPQRAKALLQEAGYGPGQLSISMVCPNGRYIKDAMVCQALQGSFQAIGINAQAKVVDRGTWSEIISRKPDKREDNMGMVGRATAGMDYTLYRLFRTGVGANTTGYSSTKVDKLLTEGRATSDVKKQKEIYAEIQKQIWEDRPFVFLWYQTQAIGVSDRVKGFQVQPNETMQFDKVSLQ